jgi:2-polyprenyl-3-methyl-5-hydroxy-6-metoxy-1,4-benzoquinol methylase
MEKDLSKISEEAWNHLAYQAWLNRLGTPEEAALKIVRDPEGRLSSLYKYFGDVSGKKVANLLGSHGSKAVALALLGADVTVVDISRENAAYAKELAGASGIDIRYVISDVLKLPTEELTGDYDIVFSELGILHYFTDLKPFMDVFFKLLKPGGIAIIQDFHPFSKLIESRGSTHKVRKHKITGDYFDTSLEETDVAFSKFLPEDVQNEIPKVQLRKWTLGEVITSVAQSGLFIKQLVEESNQSSEVFDKGIPKTFTIVAEKIL